MYNNEFSYVSKPRNKAAKYVLMGLAGSALIFVVLANLTPKYSGLVWMVAFAFIVASIYVYNRYVGAEFCYSVESVDVLSFIVTQRVGKTVRTMARLDVSAIIEVRAMTGEEYRKYKYKRVSCKCDIRYQRTVKAYGREEIHKRKRKLSERKKGEYRSTNGGVFKILVYKRELIRRHKHKHRGDNIGVLEVGYVD
jgi:hypothetical protein